MYNNVNVLNAINCTLKVVKMVNVIYILSQFLFKKWHMNTSQETCRQGSHLADILFPEINWPENIWDSWIPFHTCPSLLYENQIF